MKKKFIFFTMLLLTLMGGVKLNVLNAQETITVGSGDEYIEFMPLQTSANYAISQQIYSYEEIGKTGTITSIALKVKFGQGYTRNISVYMENIGLEEDVFPEKSYIVSASLFDGELSLVDANDKWIEIKLTTPFEYTGGNLLLCICDNTNKGESYRSSFYTYTTSDKTSYSYGGSTQYNPVQNQYTAKSWISDSRKSYKNQIKFTFGASVPSVEITPGFIDLGTVRTDADFFTEKPFDSSYYAVTVKAQGGAIIKTNTIEQEGDFFKIVGVYNIVGGYQYHISYNQNGTTGEKEGTLVVTYKDSESATETKTDTIPLRAVAYAATEGEAIENPIEVAFTDNAFTHTAKGMHDDYILPGETTDTDGNLKDAVYTFTLEEQSLITANVEGTKPIVAIYKEDFGEKDGPSSDNNYEGIQPEPSAPTTFGPYTFDSADELSNNFVNNGSGWSFFGTPGSIYEGDIYITSGSDWMLTKEKYFITSTSKLLFVLGAVNGLEIAVCVSENSDGSNLEELQTTYGSDGTHEADLSTFKNRSVYIGFKVKKSGYGGLLDDLALTDGSAKSRSVAQTRSTNQIDGVPYPAGDYYLVAAAEGDFTLNLSISELTAPAEFALTAPENNATEQNNPKLAWEAAKYALSYNVYIGTSSDLSDADTVEVTTNSYQTEGLSNNTKYYWTVEAVNEQGTTSTTSGTWSFVTTLDVPQNISANPTQIYEGESTEISWSAPEHTNGFLYYNIYVNGVKDNLEGINLEDTSYEIQDLGHNIDGHEISVTAVYDGLGESGHAKCNVKVCGHGNLNITVKDGETPIKGATVVLNGTDEFGNAVEEFTGSTNEAGALLVENVKAGEYTVAVSKFGYEEKVVTGIVVESGTPYEATISMQEKPTAPEDLLKDDVAVEEDYFDGTAIVTWTGAFNNTQMYNIYRKNVETDTVELVEENVNGTNSRPKTYEDVDYPNLKDGKYQYGVTTMLDDMITVLNESFNNGIPAGWIKGGTGGTYNQNGYYHSAPYGYYMGKNQYQLSTLTTSEIDLSGYVSAPTLSMYYKNGSGNTFKIYAKVSGDPWTLINTVSSSTNNYTQLELTLSDTYKGKTIQIMFECSKGTDYTCIDDIVIKASKLQESAPVWSNTIKKGGIVFTNNNGAGDGKWETATNWSNSKVPGAEDEVTIKYPATISSEVKVKYLAISGGRLTLEKNAVLTADEIVNNDVYSFIIKDGAQLFHNSDNVKASFTMGIVNPEGEWNENNKTGWQFIASPFADASIANCFTKNSSCVYDLYRYNGSVANKEWDNHKDNSNDQSWLYFNQGEGYLASYETLTEATLIGTLNSGVTYSWENLTYNNSKDLANFHLVGNPFTFNMDMTKAEFTNLVKGVAIVNNEGGYSYDVDTIPVGDGFFVQATNENPSLYYDHNASVSEAPVSVARRGSESNNSLNITATGNAGKDNVVINFAGKSEGFNKLQNFNDAIATVYVAEDGKNYGIYNCDADVQEVELYFNANKMGNYTISIEPNGEFETVTLVDRFTGVETNMLLEDYNFTAMSSDNHNRFIVRMVNGQESTDDSHFVYQSGEELILNIQGDVQIVDVLGRVVYNGKAMNDINRINVSSFNSGAYMIRVMNGNDVKVEKVVIY